jgi:hypothetical protein
MLKKKAEEERDIPNDEFTIKTTKRDEEMNFSGEECV